MDEITRKLMNALRESLGRMETHLAWLDLERRQGGIAGMRSIGLYATRMDIKIEIGRFANIADEIGIAMKAGQDIWPTEIKQEFERLTFRFREAQLQFARFECNEV